MKDYKNITTLRNKTRWERFWTGCRNGFIVLALVVVLMLLIFWLPGCGKNRAPHAKLEFRGSAAQTWSVGRAPAFAGQPAIENSLVFVGEDVHAFYTNGGGGDMFASNLGIDGLSWQPRGAGLPRICFPYTMQYNGMYYTFGTLCNGGKGIYVWKSTDSYSWTAGNDGKPVFTSSLDVLSPWFILWNVSATVDDSETWHFLIECAPQGANQAGVGLCYASGKLDSDVFAVEKKGQAITGGGNPWLHYVPGKGLLAIHGHIVSGGVWDITASTLSIGYLAWTTHRDKFIIGAEGAHICDPHAIQLTDGHIMMTLSNSQDWLDIVYSTDSLETFWDKLREEE